MPVDETYLNPMTGDADFGPGNPDTTGRNEFHTPGTWNLDLGMYKNTRITERMRCSCVWRLTMPSTTPISA